MLSTRPSSEAGECDPPNRSANSEIESGGVFDVKAEGNLANLANFSF
jgi:hypothetical protein